MSFPNGIEVHAHDLQPPSAPCLDCGWIAPRRLQGQWTAADVESVRAHQQFHSLPVSPALSGTMAPGFAHDDFVSSEPLLSIHDDPFSIRAWFMHGTRRQTFWRFVGAVTLFLLLMGWAAFTCVHQDKAIQQMQLEVRP